MQIEKENYNPEIHEKVRSLCVQQPWADLLTVIDWRDEKGEYHARKTIEVRSRNISYRGDLLICSSKKPEIPSRMSGVTCGFVELYDTKPIEQFTEEDWAATCIPEAERPRKGWGWLMRNPRRVVEMPVKGQLGLFDIVMPKGDLTEYPRAMTIDSDDWKLIQRQIRRAKK